MNISFKQKNRKKGFTLIEMIIAVFIFTLSLSALMTVSARGLRAARLAQNQVTADYLAIEGLEAVRNIRDAELLDFGNTFTWQDLFNDDDCWDDHVLGPDDGCGISYGSSPFEIVLYPCVNSTDDCDVYYNESAYAYRQFDGSVTSGYEAYNFIRKIQFTTIAGNPDELIVTVVVTWNEGKGRVEYTENLFLWV